MLPKGLIIVAFLLMHEGKCCCFPASNVTLETTACERLLGSSGSTCHSHRSLTSWSRAQNGPHLLCGLAGTTDTEQLLNPTVKGCSKIPTPLQHTTVTGEEQVTLGMSSPQLLKHLPSDLTLSSRQGLTLKWSPQANQSGRKTSHLMRQSVQIKDTKKYTNQRF